MNEEIIIKEDSAEVVSAETEKIQCYLKELLLKMGMTCDVAASASAESICLTIGGKDSSTIIGYHGEVLDALQYLCSLSLSKGGNLKRVVLDTENGYRAKREKTLKHLALNLEQKVKRIGHSVDLEPMNPYERRIIHTTLQNSKYVSTESEGVGNARHVVISPKEQSNILNSPNAPRKTLNFVYRSEKKRRK